MFHLTLIWQNCFFWKSRSSRLCTKIVNKSSIHKINYKERTKNYKSEISQGRGTVKKIYLRSHIYQTGVLFDVLFSVYLLRQLHVTENRPHSPDYSRATSLAMLFAFQKELVPKVEIFNKLRQALGREPDEYISVIRLYDKLLLLFYYQ